VEVGRGNSDHADAASNQLAAYGSGSIPAVLLKTQTPAAWVVAIRLDAGPWGPTEVW